MANRRLVLALFGTIHFDRLSKVRSELAPLVEDADAVFVEYPDGDVGLGTRLGAFLKTPAFAVGGFVLQLFAYGPMAILFARDLLPTELRAVSEVAGDDVPVHFVDEHPTRIMAEAGPGWIVPNWLAIAVAAWYAPSAFAVTTALGVFGGGIAVAVRRAGHRLPAIGLTAVAFAVGVAALALGYVDPVLVLGYVLAFLAFALGSAGARDEGMLDRVETVSDAAEYDSAVLVTGKGHLGGLVDRAPEYGIEIGRVHESKWLRSGIDLTDAPRSELPGLSAEDRTARPFGHPPAAIGSEAEALRRRALATIVDALALLVLAFVGGVLVGALAQVAAGDAATETGIVVGFLATPFCYAFGCEFLFGRTLGKRALGLVVVGEDGDRVSALSALVRAALWPVDALLLFLPALLTDRRQRLGDLAAGTVVAMVDRN